MYIVNVWRNFDFSKRVLNYFLSALFRVSPFYAFKHLSSDFQIAFKHSGLLGSLQSYHDTRMSRPRTTFRRFLIFLKDPRHTVCQFFTALGNIVFPRGANKLVTDFCLFYINIVYSVTLKIN